MLDTLAINYRKTLLEFISSKGITDTNIDIEEVFQQDIRNLYKQIAPLSNKSELKGILDDVTKYFKYTQNTKKVPTVARMFPKFYLQYKNVDKAAECTLVSSMLKLELESKGFKNIHCVVLSGHQIVLIENQDNGVDLLDPSNRHTDIKGEEHGFLETFSKGDIFEKTDIYNINKKYRGYSFIIKTKRKIKNTEMFSYFLESEEVYANIFFASEPNTLIELAIVCDNLDDLDEKAKYKSLVGFSSEKALKEINLFNPKPYITVPYFESDSIDIKTISKN